MDLNLLNSGIVANLAVIPVLVVILMGIFALACHLASGK